ncbi:MAG: VOC family protein [Pseudomonadota bacterium]
MSSDNPSHDVSDNQSASLTDLLPNQGIADVLYVRFQVEDLDKQQQFLDDFGFATERVDGYLLARGTDAERYCYIAEQGPAQFVEVGFAALDRARLEAIAQIEQVPVEPLPFPGGGVGAQLRDPDGRVVRLVHGIEQPEALPVPTRAPLNSGADRQRFGERVSFDSNRQIVKRLGHCVFFVNDFRTSEAWYKRCLSLLTSDEIAGPSEDKPMGAFLRCNRGDYYVDHHTLFLINAGKADFHHAAFEVADWDSVLLGHDVLQRQGYEHAMGIGKHILGSQVFDYWRDPHGFMLEHFTDGDLFNEASGAHLQTDAAAVMGSHWGTGVS